MDRKIALITGITGQDGALLARFLLDKDYTVHGMRAYAATDDLERLRGGPLKHPDFHLHIGDMNDGGNLMRLVQQIRPDEVYNLAAQSHVGASFTVPEQTANVNGIGTLRLLESIRAAGCEKKTRFYQASSSEMFGNTPGPQDENTPFAPCSPYAAAKLYAYWIVKTYRDAYDMFASNGILFNHESPLRGEEFVTRKITRHVVRGQVLKLGNLDARRDWGHARDYVEGMWLMLQHDRADDFVLATGESHSVREFVVAAYAHIGVTLHWTGSGVDEKGHCAHTGKILVEIDPALFRPLDIHHLIGNAAKAKRDLSWTAKTDFTALVADMVNAERTLQNNGFCDASAAE